MAHHVVVGTGYLGSRVLKRLPAGTAEGLSRSGPATAAGCNWQHLDLDALQQSTLELPARYTLLYTVPPPQEAADSRLERLLAMLRPEPQRIVYISTSGVYGDCGGHLIDESAPLAPKNHRALRRARAETMLQQWCSINACDLVILRTPAIYGPERLGLEKIRTATPILDEKVAPPGNRIHVDDLANCCIAALERTKIAGIYNVSDGDFRSASEFAVTVARLAGLPAPPQISQQRAETRFTKARLSFLAESRRLDNRKMRRELGIQPRDIETGIRQSLQKQTPM